MTAQEYTSRGSAKLQAVIEQIDAAAAKHGFIDDPDAFYATREDGRRYRIDMLFYAAPNCDTSILAHPPHIVRDSGEVPYVMLEGSKGIGPGREQIVKVARLTGRNKYGRWDLVLVLTDEAAYLMRGRDFDNQRWIDEIELAEADDAA